MAMKLNHTISTTRIIETMKNIKVLGLALATSLIAAPVFAGETYVRNEWTKTEGYTDTNLHLNSTTNSTRNEWYDSYADKIYADGDVSLKGSFYGKPQTVSFDDFTVHTAGSSLWGKFNETVKTTVGGTIFSHLKTKSNSHETSAGVR
jgi:hypothetical protein